MFVEYRTRVNKSLGVVEKSLDAVRGNLQDWADIAYRDGEQLRSRVGPTGGLAHQVNLTMGMAEIHSYGLAFPVKWTASGASLLFPELEADLILAAKGVAETELTLRGNYDPPLGAIGQVADRLVLHRVAEATVKDWMDRLAAALERAAMPA